MARNNVQTTVQVGMDVKLAKRNAEALKEVIATLKRELKETKTILDNPGTYGTAEIDRATEAFKRLTLQIQTLQKVQRSATPAAAYESYISGDAMNSNTLRQAQRGAKNRLNTVRYGEGDAEARKFINDINDTQKQLNRLQAGFTSPFRTIRQMPTAWANTLNRQGRRAYRTMSTASFYGIHSRTPFIETPSHLAVSRHIVVAPTFAKKTRSRYTVSIVQILSHPNLFANLYSLIDLTIAFINYRIILNFRIEIGFFRNTPIKVPRTR